MQQDVHVLGVQVGHVVLVARALTPVAAGTAAEPVGQPQRWSSWRATPPGQFGYCPPWLKKRPHSGAHCGAFGRGWP
ncbi:hypothetical protein [Verrucosispora sp. TAA-831]|uniref:hypothetical protein n=1 Tax=Verrucosispora sp. TAA-831 TaxID=3422227 RepID=UPI003D6E4735